MTLWWLANLVVLLVVVPLVVVLANRIIRAGTEINAYADDILEHGVALSGNLDPVPALLETRDTVGVVTANAVTYVDALKPLV
ncbi:hypothetical protein [Iamia sp.]|uniref:hypothetical protein n=1 Tax=Iamia sp. TaxID=2722710 RepID=UPI002CE47E61|nr:hypothetical protein [Iamia sp.]HXH58902.1 hypothetical protein [Iamia sp.]